MLITITEDPAAKRVPTNRSPAPSTSQGLERRLRILRLVRPPNGSYGFHLRGGREHGTGFFISHVEQGTEAFAQGLRTGDQVLRVNDLNVSGALHKEVASLVRSGTEVVLHVKSTGLIPVKNNPEDPLSWVLVEPGSEVTDVCENSGYPSSVSSNSTNYSPSRGGKPLQINVRGAGKYTIGCSICKGPPEKPGIFVQRVRDRGIAAEAGLRPGDQILSCNGVSFLRGDFQQAVQAMKGSSNLRLEVLRGAGLEMVTGESSGYNSSASSETGEESYSPSESDSRDGFSNSLSSTLKRLNGIRDRIQLDSNRDWKEIEDEWADAEVCEKRSQLDNSHTLLSRKLQQTSTLSKSFVNLTINEVEEEPVSRQRGSRQKRTAATPNTCNTCSHLAAPTVHKKGNLSKPRSMVDLRDSNNDDNYKIAMQMSPEVHVSKIVIPSAPKDEQNALLRLEELSSGVKNSTIVSSKSKSSIQTHNKTCSISSTSSEESANNGHYNGQSIPGLGATLKDSRQLLRCRSVPQDSNSLSEDSDSLLSFPSSTISICKSGSGRFTSKVHIRSPPPPPPPRGNATKLSRQQRKLKCGHHRKAECPHHPSVSPSMSPCISTASSSDFVSYNGALGRRQSLESLSVSSDESLHWEDPSRRPPPSHVTVNAASTTVSPATASSPHTKLSSSSLPPPPPPPPNPSHSAIPPPPPLPPPSVPSEGSSFSSQIISRQQEINGAASRLKNHEERAEVLPKKPIPDPKKMQHEKLMEEFKKAHALMVAKRQANSSDSSTE